MDWLGAAGSCLKLALAGGGVGAVGGPIGAGVGAGAGCVAGIVQHATAGPPPPPQPQQFVNTSNMGSYNSGIGQPPQVVHVQAPVAAESGPPVPLILAGVGLVGLVFLLLGPKLGRKGRR